MLCPKCKTENDDAANFCTNCRANLKSAPAEPVAPAAPAMPAEPAAPAMPAEPVAPVAPAAPAAPTSQPVSSGNPNFFAVILGACIKPITAFKENLAKFANPKNAGIVALIVVAAMTIFSTIANVVGVVRTEKCVENCAWTSSDEKKKIETKWDWNKLEGLDWFKTVGQTFLMNVLVIAIISGAYFGMSKAFKSQTANFWRMLTVVALGFIPMTITTFLSPIIGGLNETVGGIVNLAGIVYSFSIILTSLNDESGLEGDKRIYLNIASIACMLVAYYAIMRIMYGDAADLTFKAMLRPGTGSLNFGAGGLSGGSNLDLDDLDDLDDLFNF